MVADVGAHTALAIDAATFAVSGLLIRAALRSYVPPSAAYDTTSSRWSRSWREVAAGAAVVFGDRRLAMLLWLGWLALFTVVPEGLAVPFAQHSGAADGWIGVILAAEPAGAVAGALLLRLVSRHTRLRALGC